LGVSGQTGDVVYAFGHGAIGMACAAKTSKTVAATVAGRNDADRSGRVQAASV
jgi:glycine/D-amino acid oxidase-like deaminating enzyme